MKIAVAADHGGYQLKNLVTDFLNQEGHKVEDLGTNSSDSVDYPDYGFPVAEKVVQKEVDRGILICTTGIGMSILANRLPGVRAALCHSVFAAEMSRKHNDANLLVLGAKETSLQLAKSIIKIWLKTDFEGGRHQRRIDKIDAIAAKIIKKI